MTGVNKQCNTHIHRTSMLEPNTYFIFVQQHNKSKHSLPATEINCVFICNRIIYIKYTTSTTIVFNQNLKTINIKKYLLFLSKQGILYY